MDRHKVLIEYSADVSGYAAQAARMRKEIDKLNASILASQNASAVGGLNDLNRTLSSDLKAMKMWSTGVVSMENGAVQLGKSIERNNLTMSKQVSLLKDYRRNATGARGAVSELAKEQVRMSRSVTTFYQDSQGKQQARVSTPLGVNMKDAATRVAVANQEMKVYNRILSQNADATINWGKNTQWAGRQIMVGLTVPMLMFGAAAKNVFIEVDKEMTRLGKVYGAGIEGASDGAVDKIKADVYGLGETLAKEWGVSLKETAGLAAQVAATGKEGNDLLTSTREAMRLSVLGEVDRQVAMEATLSLQNAFKISNEDLAGSIDFLNAVENQTSTSLEDLAIAIPKAGPVVRSLGGDVKDLALLLTAMKEGGIDAAEGANALKSGLASMINPSKQAQIMAKGLGVDLVGIVEANKGELVPTLLEFQKALEGLDDFSRAKLIETIFGKYQFARISALFDNLGKKGSQTMQVFDLMGASAADLAANSSREMTRLTESTSMKWQRAVETFKAQLVPVGEAITKVFTAVLKGASFLLEIFENLPEPIKAFLGALAGVAALVGPFLMILGIFGNFIGQLKKGWAMLRGRQGGMFSMLTQDVMAAEAATSRLVNAQFNEENALKEINEVMQKQIALLNALAKSQENVAASAMMMSGAIQQGSAAQVASRVNLPVGSAMAETARSRYDAKDAFLNHPTAASEYIDKKMSASGDTVQKQAIEHARGVDRAAVGAATRRFGEGYAADIEGLDMDRLVDQLDKDLTTALGNKTKARQTRSVLMESLGITDRVHPEDRAKIAEWNKEVARQIAGSEQMPGESDKDYDKRIIDKKRRRSDAYSLATAVFAEKGGVVPDAALGTQMAHVKPFSENPRQFFQVPASSVDNKAHGSNQMTRDDVSRVLTERPELLGFQAATMGTSFGTAAEEALLKVNNGNLKPDGIGTEHSAETMDIMSEAIRKAEVEAERLGITVHEAFQKMAADAAQLAAPAEEIKKLSATELQATRQRLESAKEQVRISSDVSKAQAGVTSALTGLGKAAPQVEKKIQQLRDGLKKGIITKSEYAQAARELSQKTSVDPKAQASLNAAISRFEAAIAKSSGVDAEAARRELAAARAQASAAVDQQKAARDAQRAATSLASSSADIETAAARMLMGGELEVGANVDEIARSGADGGPVPRGGRMSGFMQRAEAQTTAAGIGAMGLGMLTKNEDISNLGMAVSAVGMVAMGLTALSGPLATFSASVMAAARAAAGSAVAFSASSMTQKAGSLATGLGAIVTKINPVTLALTAVAGAAWYAYDQWKKAKEARERTDRTYQAKWDVVGVNPMGYDTAVSNSGQNTSPEKRSQAREAYDSSEGSKAIVSDLSKTTDNTQKIDAFEQEYRTQLASVQAANAGDDKALAAAKERLDMLFSVIAEEAKVADQWDAVKERGATGLSEVIDSRMTELEATEKKIMAAASKGVAVLDGKILGMAQDEVNAGFSDIAREVGSEMANGFKAAAGAGDMVSAAKSLVGGFSNIQRIMAAGKMNEGIWSDIVSQVAAIDPALAASMGTWQQFEASGANVNYLLGDIIGKLNVIPREILITLTVQQQGELITQFGIFDKATDEAQAYIESQTKIRSVEERTGASYESRLKSMEAASEAAERAHEASQEAREEEIDAIEEVIDGKQKHIDSIQDEIDAIQDSIDKINDEREAKKKALEEAKEAEDFYRSQAQSQVDYYDAIARGDMVDATKIATQMSQDSADYQYGENVDKIDAKYDAKVGEKEKQITAKENRIAQIEAEIEKQQERIDAIQKVSDAADKAFQKSQQQRQDAIKSFQDQKEKFIAGQRKMAQAAYDREKSTRDEAVRTANRQIAELDKMAAAGRLSDTELRKRAGYVARDLAAKLGWGPEKENAFKRNITSSLLSAWTDVLQVLNIKDAKITGNIAEWYKANPETRVGGQLSGGGVPSKPEYDPRYPTHHTGSYVSKDASPTNGLKSDEVNRTLQVGEYVVQRKAVNKYGKNFLSGINSGSVPVREGKGSPGMLQAALGSKARSALAEKLVTYAHDDYFPKMAAQMFGARPTSGISGTWTGKDMPGVSSSAQAAVARAMNDFTNEVGYCLRQVREWWNVPGRYGSASIAWQNAQKRHKDANPKIGAPVFWTGGSQGYGHVAMYVGNGSVRSTDAAGAGRVGTVPISRYSGGNLNFEGWTEDLNGVALQLRKGGMVLKDNTLANLHKNEAVLRAPIAKSLEDGIKGIKNVPDIMGTMQTPSNVDQSRHEYNLSVQQLPGESTDDLVNKIFKRIDDAGGRVGKK